MKTIIEAKAHLKKNASKGVACPVCDQYVRIYMRKLNSGMALFLIGLYKLYMENRGYDPIGFHPVNSVFRGAPIFPPDKFYQNKEVFEIMNLKLTSLDYSVLKHFNLIEPRISETGKKDSGYWKLTYKGKDFIGYIGTPPTSPKHVFLYNNKRQGFSDETITIKEALGSKFDFDELMQG